MATLRFRLPGRDDALGGWLARLLPEIGRATRRSLLGSGRIRIDGQIAAHTGTPAPPGARIEIELTEAEVDRFASRPPHSVGERRAVWHAIVDDGPWARGEIESAGGGGVAFERVAAARGFARLALSGPEATADQRRLDLAHAGLPVVGDLACGGLAVPGGAWIFPPDSRHGDWPEDVAWRAALDEVDSGSHRAELVVSDETARALAAGHPWLLPDAAGEPASRYRRGALVRLVDRASRTVGFARIEAEHRIAARVWADAASEPDRLPSVEARVARALARRRRLLAPEASSATNAIRLVHAEADGFPGLFVDRLGPLLRVLATGWASEGFRAHAIDALLDQLPVTPEGAAWSVLEVLHLQTPRGLRPERVRWRVGGPDQLVASGADTSGSGLWVREAGLEYFVDPGWADSYRARPGYGLFVDQRENRAWLREQASSGGHWLNLFAHTGGFSVALLAGGADQVVSVDLSAPYLARLEANLIRNDAALGDAAVGGERHRVVRGDARRVLAGPERGGLVAGARFRGIVIDPPTAASAGRQFWSVRQDLEPLLRRALERLEDGGCLVVSQNRMGPPIGLDRILERIVRRGRRRANAIEPLSPGTDHPRLAGFPEGDCFEGWRLTLR